MEFDSPRSSTRQSIQTMRLRRSATEMADGQIESAADVAFREGRNLAHLAGVEVECVVKLGRRNMKLSEAKSLKVGSVVSMEKPAGERFEVLLNDQSFAFADIVVRGEGVTARIAKMVDIPSGASQLARQLRERRAREGISLHSLCPRTTPGIT
jgi:flagellar motor switch/type III secretory pathway protein FliN